MGNAAEEWQRLSWCDEIKMFVLIVLNQLAQDMVNWGLLAEAFVLEQDRLITMMTRMPYEVELGQDTQESF